MSESYLNSYYQNLSNLLKKLSNIVNKSIQVEDTLSQKTDPGQFLDVVNKTVLICKR